MHHPRQQNIAPHGGARISGCGDGPHTGPGRDDRDELVIINLYLEPWRLFLLLQPPYGNSAPDARTGEIRYLTHLLVLY